MILRRRESPWLTGQIYVQPLHFVFHHGPNGQAGVLWFWHRHRNPWIRILRKTNSTSATVRVIVMSSRLNQPFGRIAGRRHVVARNRIKHWQGSESHQHRHRPRTTQPWWGRCWWRLYWWLLGPSWPSETWRLRVVPTPTSPGIPAEEGCPNGSRTDSDCTLERRGQIQNGGEPVRGGPRSTRIKSAIPSANGRRAAKHEHGRNDDGKSTAVCSRKKRLWKKRLA